MKKIIYIKDKTGNFLDVALPQILEEFESIGDKYIWSILDFEVTRMKDDPDFYDIPQHVDCLNRYNLSWDKLKKLANNIYQTINLSLVANINKELIESVRSLIYENPIVIEIEDGYCWEVYTEDETIMNAIQKKYKDIEVKEI